jgi:hypothetical protein
VRCHQVITVEHRKIEELAGDFNANRVQADVLWTGSTIAVSKKTG